MTAWVRDATLGLLRARAADFLGLAEVQRLLDELEQFAPATVRNVVPKPVGLVLLTEVLRRLVEERVSVRDLRAILEALSTLAATEKDPLSLTEYVRGQLRRAITFRLTRGSRASTSCCSIRSSRTPCVAPSRERRRARSSRSRRKPRGTSSPSIRRALASAPAGEHAQKPVVLTQPDIRRFVRKLLEPELPDVWVASFAELLPEIALKPVARATAA